ncbi:MAG: hypothetical protein ACXAC8_04450 [Candidatus Hodarchaeales archaeon]
MGILKKFFHIIKNWFYFRHYFIIKCLVTRSYMKTPSCDADMFTEIISVISIFTRNILWEKVQHISLEHTTIYLQSKNGLMIAITAFNCTSSKFFKKIFQKLFLAITIEYGGFLSLSVINAAFFQPFYLTIDEIIRDAFISRMMSFN